MNRLGRMASELWHAVDELFGCRCEYRDINAANRCGWLVVVVGPSLQNGATEHHSRYLLHKSEETDRGLKGRPAERRPSDRRQP